MDWKYKPTPDFIPEPGKVYIRSEGADDWQELGIVDAASLKDEGRTEVRVNIPAVRVLSQSGDTEVDISDQFDLDSGFTLTAVFDTTEAAEDFARRWSKEGA